MKLNGISCTNYTAGERFTAVLRDTTEDAVRSIDAATLAVQTDDGGVVETYDCYGRLFSLRHLITDDIFEVEFERLPKSELAARDMAAFIEGIREAVENGE